MRISDWSSDVCSSDLVPLAPDGPALGLAQHPVAKGTAGAAAVERTPAPLRPAQHRADARDKLARIEGFDDIIVGADLQPDDAFGILGARGQQDDGNAARLAQMAGQRQTILAGHHNVADDEVDRLCAQHRARLGGARGVDDRKALRSEEHTSELQSLMRSSYAVF